MPRKLLVLVFAVALLCGQSESSAQDKKERTATVSGILKSRTELKNRKDLIIEILADGDLKPRRYGVPHVPNGKGPITEVLGAVNKASIGDRVFCNLVYGAYGYEGGFTVITFEVQKKAEVKKEEDKEKKYPQLPVRAPSVSERGTIRFPAR